MTREQLAACDGVAAGLPPDTVFVFEADDEAEAIVVVRTVGPGVRGLLLVMRERLHAAGFELPRSPVATDRTTAFAVRGRGMPSAEIVGFTQAVAREAGLDVLAGDG